MKKLLIIFILFIPFPLFAETLKWDNTEKTLFMSYTYSTILDSLQTRDIFENHDRYHERNDIINYFVKKTGKGSIPVYFILLNIFHYQIADHLSHKWRKGYLISINCFSYNTVRKNYNLGLKFNF